MRAFLMTTILGFSMIAHAGPITIENSQSPDGKYFLSIEPHEYEGCASGIAQIRLRKTERIVGTFEWQGFGVTPNSTTFSVLWNLDCTAFTISYEYTRGYMYYGVYVLHNKKWVNVKPPDYLKIIFKEQKISEGGDKGFQTPGLWRQNDILKLNVGGRASIKKGEESRMIYFHSEVWLHLKDYDSGPLLSIVKIRELQPE